jgi:hypothetical protein
MGGSVQLDSRSGRTAFVLVLPSAAFSPEKERVAEPSLQ